MKKYLFWIMIILAVVVVSCDNNDDPKESCDSEDVTGDFSCPVDVNAIATFCSDGVNKAYFTFNGEDYECQGVSEATCDSALDAIAVALIEAGCVTKKANGMEVCINNLSEMAKNLLADVRTESLCD